MMWWCDDVMCDVWCDDVSVWTLTCWSRLVQPMEDSSQRETTCWGRWRRASGGRRPQRRALCGPSWGGWGCGWGAWPEGERTTSSEQTSPPTPARRPAAGSGRHRRSSTCCPYLLTGSFNNFVFILFNKAERIHWSAFWIQLLCLLHNQQRSRSITSCLTHSWAPASCGRRASWRWRPSSWRSDI